MDEEDANILYRFITFSFVTCLLRLYHNKHWFSDVATGALLGVLSAKLSGKLINLIKISKRISICDKFYALG